jgi:type III secretory pathway component EscT
MLFDMGFSRFFSMMSSVAGVSTCGVCVMCCLFVMTAFVVLGGILMVLRSMLMVL